jgi:hypothetical protein
MRAGAWISWAINRSVNMRILKVIIAGGRGFSDFELLTDSLDRILSKAFKARDEVRIISGTAQGADRMGEQYAVDHHLEVDRYPADWDRYGRSAGYKRNVQMAKVATHLVAFWDGQSRGTKHMIDIAVRLGLTVVVVYYNTSVMEKIVDGEITERMSFDNPNNAWREG